VEKESECEKDSDGKRSDGEFGRVVDADVDEDDVDE
jgi:hypothetical protein